MYADILNEEGLAEAERDRASVLRTADSGSGDVKRQRYRDSKTAGQSQRPPTVCDLQVMANSNTV